MRNATLTQRAREIRKAMPEPETRLWLELRAQRFMGIKFRRQKVIGNYIADFASNEPRLVIELDGESHAGRLKYDAARTRFIEGEGYQVIRFSNNDVMANLEGVLVRLGDAIADLKSPAPLPTLSPEGERAI